MHASYILHTLLALTGPLLPLAHAAPTQALDSSTTNVNAGVAADVVAALGNAGIDLGARTTAIIGGGGKLSTREVGTGLATVGIDAALKANLEAAANGLASAIVKADADANVDVGKRTYTEPKLLSVNAVVVAGLTALLGNLAASLGVAANVTASV